MSDARPDGGAPGTRPRHGAVAALLSRGIVGAGFIPVWIALGLLIAVAAIIAPETLSSTSWSAVLPFMTFLAIASLEV